MLSSEQEASNPPPPLAVPDIPSDEGTDGMGVDAVRDQGTLKGADIPSYVMDGYSKMDAYYKMSALAHDVDKKPRSGGGRASRVPDPRGPDRPRSTCGPHRCRKERGRLGTTTAFAASKSSTIPI